jgi:acylphosphatase
MIACKQVVYRGHVQGVGFRYTARRVSEDYEVAGFVRNLPSGEVELWVEGEADQVQAFLDALQAHMRGYIAEQDVREHTPAGCRGFVIRH